MSSKPKKNKVAPNPSDTEEELDALLASEVDADSDDFVDETGMPDSDAKRLREALAAIGAKVTADGGGPGLSLRDDGNGEVDFDEFERFLGAALPAAAAAVAPAAAELLDAAASLPAPDVQPPAPAENRQPQRPKAKHKSRWPQGSK